MNSQFHNYGNHNPDQKQPHEIEDDFFDVIIIGAGPAGTANAIILSERGFKVLLIEKDSFPRDKICGDSLLPDTHQLLRELGVFQQIVDQSFPVDGLRIFSVNGSENHIHGRIKTIIRSNFDTLMANHAVKTGAVLCQGLVEKIQLSNTDSAVVQLRGSTRQFHSRIVVIATGAQIGLLRTTNLYSEPSTGAVAMRSYFRSSLDINSGIISYDRSIRPGFAWIFPLGNGLFNVGCGIISAGSMHAGSRLREAFKRFLSSFPLAVNLMKLGEQVSPLQGFPLRCGLCDLGHITDRNILAVGEAIGTTYPYTGEGIGPAIKSGMIAGEVIAGALASGDFRQLENYPVRLRAELMPVYRGYEKAQRWLSNTWLNNIVSWRIRNSKHFRSECEGIIAGSSDPTVVYSGREMFLSFFR
jgi:geranylgeranyl reductase family protein